jgi:hypothetical protein
MVVIVSFEVEPGRRMWTGVYQGSIYTSSGVPGNRQFPFGLGEEGDGGEEAAGEGALFAVAEEEVGAARGAEVAYENVLRAEAGVEELEAVGFAEVEADVFGRRLVPRGEHVEPLERIGFVAGAKLVKPFVGVGELRRELRGDFGADFVAAGADGGAESGEDVGGIGGEVHLHLADGFGSDALERATPAGVNGGDGAFFDVNEEDGDAVGRLHGEEEAGCVGDGGVAFAGRCGSGAVKMDDVGVDLFQGNEREIGGAEGGPEAAAIFENVFAGVVFGEGEVEEVSAKGIEVADAAVDGAEAVEKPGELGEGGDLEDLEAAGGESGPLGRGKRGNAAFIGAAF